MKVIGDRISILNTPELLSIVILPFRDEKKLRLLLFWLLAWTACGVIVIANYFKLQDQSSKLFVIIYLSFWIYYEIKITRAFLWKKFGKEKIWIKDGVLNYQQEIKGKGKLKKYEILLINDLKIIEIKQNNFSDFINQSFWIKGGERLEVSYKNSLVRFGMQLSDKEAQLVVKPLSECILRELDKR
ncbi:MAG: hypothetical protein HYX39_14075 [Bacteroidetes bacterium]|nr:hypothetical protein [Bacteroidota bacterium]